VYSIDIDGKNCEVAFARTERKIGTGYHGFKVNFDSDVNIEQDLYRRDTTINAMALDILRGEVIDPFGGREDVANKKIRAVSEHFTDDPVRALRAARQSAQFDFEITPETLEAMNLCAFEIKNEPGERIFSELKNALKTKKPSIFFRNLERAGILSVTFPEIDNLRGKTQPVEFHPEGDAYEHSLLIVDEISKINPKPEIRFAALAHDFGKGTTPPEMLPHHYKHDKRGLDVLEEMNQRIILPTDWKKIAAFVISEHMRAPQMTHPGKIVDFLIKLHNSIISIEDFNDIINLDNHGLPLHLANAKIILAELLKISGKNAPAELKGAEIGDWIRKERVKVLVALVR
jgi:tRNA nucleotidyltransferase (CCA-adding enzyme)